MVRVYGVFGDPIGHSLSPLMHNMAFKALGMNCVYLPFRVEPKNLPEAVQAIRALELGGVNVTIPHKEAVAPYLDRIEGEARFTGSVNTIVNKEGVLYGFSTDGQGLLLSLQKEGGFSPAGKKVVILGAGGAARAVAFSLIGQGAAELSLVNRTRSKAESLAELIKKHTGFIVQCLDYEDPQLSAEAKSVDLLVNATPLGMYPHLHTKPPFPLAECSRDCLVYDLVYRPVETRFLQEAKEYGLKTLSGLGMLVYQGVLAFNHWTGVDPPQKPMRLVVEEFLQAHPQQNHHE